LPPCRLGEHNGYVYSELLGCSPKEYERMEVEGHIGTRYVIDSPAPNPPCDLKINGYRERELTS